jgi:hypothetical protein
MQQDIAVALARVGVLFGPGPWRIGWCRCGWVMAILDPAPPVPRVFAVDDFAIRRGLN